MRWVIETLFIGIESIVHKGRENGVNTVVFFNLNENMYQYRKYRNNRENKHIGVGSQPVIREMDLGPTAH